jgi:DNA ligase-4
MVRLILREHCTIKLDEKFVLGQYQFLLPDLLLFRTILMPCSLCLEAS